MYGLKPVPFNLKPGLFNPKPAPFKRQPALLKLGLGQGKQTISRLRKRAG
jgi:hypothetical protein